MAETYQIEFYNKHQQRRLDWVEADSESEALRRIHKLHKIERIISVKHSKYTLLEIEALD